MTKVGKNIKSIRLVQGLSQQAFADLFQLTRGNISSYEEKRAEPRIETIVSIANYFGIPLTDFILKELTLNELKQYHPGKTALEEELKKNFQLEEIPFISALHRSDYALHYNDDAFIRELPHIVVPGNYQFEMIAFELENPDILPSGLDYKTGDVLVFEHVVKENIHRILNRFGMSADKDGIKRGVFKHEENGIFLYLNEFIKYPFDIESDTKYWVLRALYTQLI
jgi:Predicted transcriptional regulators